MSDNPLDRFSSLVEAAAGVVEQTDLKMVLKRLVSEARAATGARYAALGVLGYHGVLSDFIYEGLTDDEAAAIGRLPTGKGLLGTVVRLRKTIRVEDIADHPDASGFPDHHPSMSNFLGVPVAVGDEAFGNLYLTDKEGGFTDQDEGTVEALSRIAGAAVKTSRLQSRLRQIALTEDRQRIARDLHDTVIQDLFAVGLGIQGVAPLVDDPHVESLLLDSVDRLDKAVEALRNHIFQLRESDATNPTLDESLGQLVDQMSAAYPATVVLDARVTGTGDDLVDNEVIRIVTEALSNALRHSSADVVRIHVENEESILSIQVTDDGRGFDPEAPTRGMGLDNLRTRVNRLGGELSIRTGTEGTEVEARLPLN